MGNPDDIVPESLGSALPGIHALPGAGSADGGGHRPAACTPFVGRCLEYDALSPVTLAAAMVDELDRSVDYRPVESDGAARAASLVAELL